MPLLIIGGIVALIAHEKIPAFADWWERTFSPAVWQTKTTCRQAALADLQGGQYARPLGSGELHDTQDGPYVTQMTFSVLGTDGEEQVIEYNCYLDSHGQLFRLNRKPE